jgi:hypothetical protein
LRRRTAADRELPAVVRPLRNPGELQESTFPVAYYLKETMAAGLTVPPEPQYQTVLASNFDEEPR